MSGWLNDWERAKDEREEERMAAAAKHGVVQEDGVWVAYYNNGIVASGPDKVIIQTAFDHHAATEPVSDRLVNEVVTEFVEKVGKFRQALRDQRIHVGIGQPPVCATCDTVWPCDEVER